MNVPIEVIFMWSRCKHTNKQKCFVVGIFTQKETYISYYHYYISVIRFVTNIVIYFLS